MVNTKNKNADQILKSDSENWLSNEETKARLDLVEKELSDGFDIIGRHRKTVTVFGSARTEEDNVNFQNAVAVGARLSQDDYTIVTGGSNGIMKAANQGAYEQGGQSIGFNIMLPHEQSANPYTTDIMSFHYFFTRKLMLTFGASGYVYFPGGFGTMDELFEILTLIQTGKTPLVPIVLFGSSFWNKMDKFIKDAMLDNEQTISPGDTAIYTITDDVEEVAAIINNFQPAK